MAEIQNFAFKKLQVSDLDKAMNSDLHISKFPKVPEHLYPLELYPFSVKQRYCDIA